MEVWDVYPSVYHTDDPSEENGLDDRHRLSLRERCRLSDSLPAARVEM